MGHDLLRCSLGNIGGSGGGNDGSFDQGVNLFLAIVRRISTGSLHDLSFLLLNINFSLILKYFPKFLIGPYGEQIISTIFLFNATESLSSYFADLILVLENECGFFVIFPPHW